MLYLSRRLNSALTISVFLGFYLASAETPQAVSPTTVAETYAELARRSYQAALDEAVVLQTAVHGFAATPDLAGLNRVRATWRKAHDAYSPTEVFRFVGGPIDSATAGVETRLNAWPLDEQWLDATIDQPNAGLISSTVAIEPETLREYNEKDGEKNIVLGYHALEFLIWGQDRDPKGPGNRPLTEFTSAARGARRLIAMRLISQQIVDDLRTVVSEWQPQPGTYRSALLAGDPLTALKSAFTGMVMLAGDELSGERMAVAWETQDQEEEQSCFSDNTLADHAANAAGIAMVWHGRLGNWSGPSLAQLIAPRNPEIAAQLSARIARSIAAIAVIPAPFDQAILGDAKSPGRVAILTAIESLEQQAEDTVAAAKVLGIAVEYGANPNNAIIAFTAMRTQLSALSATAAATIIPALEQQWLRSESAIRQVDPTLYRSSESALQALRNAALRARTPDSAKISAASATLDRTLAGCIARLKQP